MPASYLKGVTQATTANNNLDEQEVEETKFDMSDIPGVRPTVLGVFPVKCVVETVCGGEDDPEQWIPADIIKVIPVVGKETVPIDKLTPSDGEYLI